MNGLVVDVERGDAMKATAPIHINKSKSSRPVKKGRESEGRESVPVGEGKGEPENIITRFLLLRCKKYGFFFFLF